MDLINWSLNETDTLLRRLGLGEPDCPAETFAAGYAMSCTDHNPLVFLTRMQNSNQRLMRWSLLVQDFNLEIHHKKGTENVMADAPSRGFLST